MSITAKYLFIVSMDVEADKEDLFNEVYDNEHLLHLSRVPGVISARRLKRQPLTVNIGDQTQVITTPDEPTYMAIYEIESPEVLVSEAWAAAGEEGRWSTEGRPYTTNRRHVLRKIL